MKNIDKLVYIFFGILMITYIVFSYINNTKSEDEIMVKDNEVFMICDVYNLTEDSVEIVQPNGEIHSYDMPIDAPEEFDEVVIATDNLDDYDTYEIVGLR